MDLFLARPIAHRGLFDLSKDIPENSMPAFRRAIEEGYTIELDVQMSTDHELFVFHDADLLRACGSEGRVYRRTYEELKEERLFGTKERIPLLSDVLALIDDRVPLVIEIKPRGDYLETTRRTVELLRDYPCSYCLESFHPRVLAFLKKEHPEILRGQIACSLTKKESDTNALISFALKKLMVNFLSRPDFICYRRNDKKPLAFRLAKILNIPCIAWNVRSESDYAETKKEFDGVIFDSFLP